MKAKCIVCGEEIEEDDDRPQEEIVDDLLKKYEEDFGILKTGPYYPVCEKCYEKFKPFG